MHELSEPTLEEQRLMAAWQQRPVVWTPECIDPEELIALVEQADDYPRATALFAHIAGCGYCSREYRDMLEAFDLAGEEQGQESVPQAIAGRATDGSMGAAVAPPDVAPAIEGNALQASATTDAPSIAPAGDGPRLRIVSAQETVTPVAPARSTLRQMSRLWTMGAGAAVAAGIAVALWIPTMNRDTARIAALNGQRLALQADRNQLTAVNVALQAKVERLNSLQRADAIRLAAQAHTTKQLQLQLSHPRDVIARNDDTPTQEALQHGLPIAAALADRFRDAPVVGAIGETRTLQRGAAETDEVTLISPISTGVTETTPTLSWQPLKGAVSYMVALRDRQGQSFTSQPIKEPHWTVSPPLKMEHTYDWQVVVHRADGDINSARARFTVLGTAQAKQAERETLAMGVRCAQLGLLQDAARLFAAIPQKSPRYADAQRLLSNLQARRFAPPKTGGTP